MTSLFLIGLTLFAAPPGAAELATRLGLATDAIQSVQPVVLNRRTLGHLVRFKRGSKTYGVLASVQGPRVSLGEVDAFDYHGIIDLAGAGRLPMQHRHPSRLKSAGMTDPAWVLITRHTKAATDAPARKGRRYNRAATQEILHLIRLSGLQRVLRVKTKRRSTDGFGGHDISGLTLARVGGAVEITGSRQDRLPAHRARCMKPPPVPVRYVMHNGEFRESDPHATAGCGSRKRMPIPIPKVPKTLRP